MADIWNGDNSDNAFSTAANYEGDSAPANTNTVVFPAMAEDSGDNVDGSDESSTLLASVQVEDNCYLTFGSRATYLQIDTDEFIYEGAGQSFFHLHNCQNAYVHHAAYAGGDYTHGLSLVSEAAGTARTANADHSSTTQLVFLDQDYSDDFAVGSTVYNSTDGTYHTVTSSTGSTNGGDDDGDDDTVVVVTPAASTSFAGLSVQAVSVGVLTVDPGQDRPVGVAALGGESASISGLVVASGDVEMGDAVTIISRVALMGGKLTNNGDVPTMDVSGGTLTQVRNNPTTLNIDKGRVYYNSADMPTTVTIGPKGILDMSKDGRAKTIATVNLYPGGQIIDPGNILTITTLARQQGGNLKYS